MSKWFVIAGGDVTRQVASLGGEDTVGKTVTAVDRCGDLRFEHPDSEGVWHVDLEAYGAVVMEAVDVCREAAQQRLLTAGSVKTMVYAQKTREAERYTTMGASAFAALSAAARREAYPAASAEAKASSETLGAVLDRIVATNAAINTKIYQLDAAAVAAKRAIRAASSREAIDQAALIDWTGETL